MTHDDEIRLSVRGPGASLTSARDAGAATRRLLEEIGHSLGHDVKIQIAAVFRCDGCGLERADRPSANEGWTYDKATRDDYCPACSASAHTDAGGELRD